MEKAPTKAVLDAPCDLSKVVELYDMEIDQYENMGEEVDDNVLAGLEARRASVLRLLHQQLDPQPLPSLFRSKAWSNELLCTADGKRRMKSIRGMCLISVAYTLSGGGERYGEIMHILETAARDW